MNNFAKIKKNLNNIVKYYSNSMYEIGNFTQFGQKPTQIVEFNATQNASKTIEVQEVQKPTIKYTNSPQNQIITSNISSSKQDDLSNITTLEELILEVDKTCKCELKAFATKTVFGNGNPNAKILIIGEAPGQEEDLAGIPFIGRSGELLMNAFKSIKLEREKNFFITNNIFWRPPGNRKPTQEEMDSCKPYLIKMIKIIQPEVVICVGSVATQNVLGSQDTISNLRAKIFNEAKPLNFNGKIFAIYHPSYLLRNPSKKYEMYKDLLFIKEQIPHLL
jgi:DNA polymerase